MAKDIYVALTCKEVVETKEVPYPEENAKNLVVCSHPIGVECRDDWECPHLKPHIKRWDCPQTHCVLPAGIAVCCVPMKTRDVTKSYRRA